MVRSGKARDGLQVHAGTIDADYRKEVMIMAETVKDEALLKAGEPVAQLILLKSFPFGRSSATVRDELQDFDIATDA